MLFLNVLKQFIELFRLLLLFMTYSAEHFEENSKKLCYRNGACNSDVVGLTKQLFRIKY